MREKVREKREEGRERVERNQKMGANNPFICGYFSNFGYVHGLCMGGCPIFVPRLRNCPILGCFPKIFGVLQIGPIILMRCVSCTLVWP